MWLTCRAHVLSVKLTVTGIYSYDDHFAGYSDEMLELLLFALRELKDSFAERGSDLMIRFGRVEKILPELVKEVLICKIL